MTELSFLIELLLNHELPVGTKHAIAERIKEVEKNLQVAPVRLVHAPAPAIDPRVLQSPSTIALMAKHGHPIDAPVMPPVIEPQPVAQVAQNPITAAAMNKRNSAISDSIAGKVDKQTGRPKKW